MFIGSLSNSKRDTYHECGWKYYLEYEEKIPQLQKKPEYLDFGSLIHKIFERGYTCTTVDELRKIALEEKLNYPIDDSYNKKIEICINNFLKFNSSLQNTIETELNFRVPLVEGVPFNGIIDRVIKAKFSDEYLIIDYKTGRVEKTRSELFNDDQLQGYVFAWAKLKEVSVTKITASHYYPLTDNFVPVKFIPNQIKLFEKSAIRDVWDIRKKKKTELVPIRNKFCNNCRFQKDLCHEFSPKEIVLKRIDEVKSIPRKAHGMSTDIPNKEDNKPGDNKA